MTLEQEQGVTLLEMNFESDASLSPGPASYELRDLELFSAPCVTASSSAWWDNSRPVCSVFTSTAQHSIWHIVGISRVVVATITVVIIITTIRDIDVYFLN